METLWWVYRHDCGDGSVCNVAWAHTTRTGHTVVSLKTDGKHEEALCAFLWISRGGKAAHQSVAQEKQLTEAGNTRADTQALPTHNLDFGKCKGNTIMKLHGSKDTRLAEHIPWLFASSSNKRDQPPTAGAQADIAT